MSALRKLPYKKAPFHSGIWDNVEFTIGAEAGDVINVGIQLKAGEEDLAESVALKAYLSANDDGSTLATAPDTVAIGTDGLLIENVSDLAFTVVSEADGDVDINVGKSGAATYYLVLVSADGKLHISDPITFAA